jgi:predicted nuclease of predicted toxin-antitoxin system
MRFLIDAQLPPALVPWLAAKGHHAQHVIDCGLEAADDRAIWDEAIRTGAVIVTKDEDFALRRTLAVPGPCVVWVRRGNATRRENDPLVRGRTPDAPRSARARRLVGRGDLTRIDRARSKARRA